MNETLTLAKVVRYVEEKGFQPCSSTADISMKLKTISARTVRSYISKGELKPMDVKQRPYVFTIESIAEFLLNHPRYMLDSMNREKVVLTEERYKSLVEQIKAAVHAGWRPLLKFLDLDDIVSEVIMRILNMRSIDGVNDYTLIYRTLAKVARKEMKRPLTLLLNEGLTKSQEEENNEED